MSPKQRINRNRLTLTSSNTQIATLHGIGLSLADIAAFIEEVELDFGMRNQKDRGRVERMRSFALNLSRVK